MRRSCTGVRLSDYQYGGAGGSKRENLAYPQLKEWWCLKRTLAASRDLIVASPYVLNTIQTDWGLSGPGRWPGLRCSGGIVG